MVAKKSSIIIISALFITLTIGIFWGINKYFYDSLIKQNGEKGLVVLKNIENTLDKEEVQDIFGKQEHSNPYYIDMVNKFKQIERDNELLYIYTIHYDEKGALKYDIVSDKLNDILGQPISHEELTDEVMYSLHAGEERYTESYKTEQWGQLTSCNIPLKDNEGNIMGVLGLGLPQEHIRRGLIQIFIKTIIVLMLFIIMITILAHTVLEKYQEQYIKP